MKLNVQDVAVKIFRKKSSAEYWEQSYNNDFI